MPAAAAPQDTTDAAWLEALVGAAPEALVALLRRRPDLSARRLDTVGALSAAVIDPRSVAAFHGQCDRTTQEVLEALCVVGQPATVGRLEAVLGTGPGALGAHLDGLAEAFLVRPADGERLLVNPGLAGAIGRPAHLGPSLRRILLDQSMDLLRDAARRTGLPVAKTKGATADRIVEQYSDPAAVGRLVDAGPEGTRQLAERVATAGPEVALGAEAHVLARNDTTPAGYLLRRGLLVATSWRRAVMTAEVAVALRGGRVFPGFRLDPPPLELVTLPGLADGPAAEAAQRLVADVASILELWGAVPPKLLQAGGVGVREVRRTGKAIARPEAEVARLVELAAAAGLVSPQPEEQLALPTVAYDTWRTMPTSERWAVLAGAWWTAPVHLSLAGSPDESGKPVPPLLDRDVEANAIARRQAVLALVAGLPEDALAETGSLVERLCWSRPAMWRGGPEEPVTLVGWILEEAALLGVASGGRLGAFGRALAGGDGLAEAVELLAGHLPPLVSDLVLQADLTALVAGEIHPDLRAELELLADIESAGAATLWRFSPRSLERAFDAGRSSEEILAFLEAHARKGVPQPLAYLVADLGRRFGQLRVGTSSCYVRAEDPSLLAELVRARRVAGLRLRLLAPTVACSHADPALVVSTLRDGGYLAAAEDVDGALVVTRPPARRAGNRPTLAHGGDEDLYDEDPYDEDLYDAFDPGELDPELVAALAGEPELVAALTGMPVELLRALGPAMAHGGGLPVPEDPESLVRRLLAGPRPDEAADPRAGRSRSRSSPAPGPGPAPGSAVEPPPGPARLRLVDDPADRPNRIGRSPDEVADLVERAFEEGWLVRLSCANGRGEERELDALVVGLDERTVTVRRLPRGDLQEVARSRIRWVRVLTEAEEEARL